MTATTALPEKEMDMKRLLNQLYDAFSYFNYELFNNILPDVSISIGYKRGSEGVYYAERFVPKNNDDNLNADPARLDDILMNPASFHGDEKHVLSVLVHEMVHQWEEHHGKPGKGGYHNRQWAESMKQVGLHPSTTGEPGGKETGRKVSHYIVEGGLFDTLCDTFIEETDFSIGWFILDLPRKKTSPRKRTYRCDCPQPMYANLSGRNIQCLDCGTQLEEDEIDVE